MWDNQHTQTPNISPIKQRLRDQYIQTWSANIANTSKLDYYVRYKDSFEREPYLNVLKSDIQRKYMTAFRTASHKLEIETGRYTNTPRNNRIYVNCAI